MRTSFIETLSEIAAHDPRVTLVVGDLGFGVVTDFASRYPQQFLNAGVAEQNMTGLAAGMALAGRIVFTYSIANFPTLRCIEQIRNDVCYHQANVKIVAVGGGYAYGSLGMTHHATEDLAILRSLPGLKVVAPGDPVETRLAVRALVADPSPCYLRLGRAGEPALHAGDIDFAIGRAITVREGSDATLISTGGMLENCLTVARRLAAEGVHAQVISMHTVKPLDQAAVVQAGRKTGVVLTVEEHSEVGGLGWVSGRLPQDRLAGSLQLGRGRLRISSSPGRSGCGQHRPRRTAGGPRHSRALDLGWSQSALNVPPPSPIRLTVPLNLDFCTRAVLLSLRPNSPGNVQKTVVFTVVCAFRHRASDGVEHVLQLKAQALQLRIHRPPRQVIMQQGEVMPSVIDEGVVGCGSPHPSQAEIVPPAEQIPPASPGKSDGVGTPD